MARCGTMHIAIARGKLRWLVYPLLRAVLGGAGNSSRRQPDVESRSGLSSVVTTLVTDHNRLSLVVG